GAYDYRVDAALELKRGDFVIVPLGKREVLGVVWGEGRGDVDDAKLRAVSARVEAAPLPAGLCQFVDWVAQYTLSPPGAVLGRARRAPGALEPPRPIAAWALAASSTLPAGMRITPERQRVLAVLADGPPRPTAELAREAGVGMGVVKSLAQAG